MQDKPDPVWGWSSPGTVYRTLTLTKLADGRELGQVRRLIFWCMVAHDDRRDPRTNERELSVLVTWADEGGTKPVDGPFWITAYSHGWRERDGECISGELREPVGQYVASDPRGNSIEIMQAAYLKRAGNAV